MSNSMPMMLKKAILTIRMRDASCGAPRLLYGSAAFLLILIRIPNFKGAQDLKEASTAAWACFHAFIHDEVLIPQIWFSKARKPGS